MCTCTCNGLYTGTYNGICTCTCSGLYTCTCNGMCTCTCSGLYTCTCNGICTCNFNIMELISVVSLDSRRGFLMLYGPHQILYNKFQ